MNSDLLDLELPTGPGPDWKDPVMPFDLWDEWVKNHRIRLTSEGKIDPNEIPKWKGEPFVWKD